MWKAFRAITLWLSWLLFLAAVFLWVRGRFAGDFFARSRQTLDEREYAYFGVYLESGKGSLGLFTMTFTAPAATARAAGYVPPGETRLLTETVRPPMGTIERWGLLNPPVTTQSWSWHRAGIFVYSSEQSSTFAPATGVILAVRDVRHAVVVPCWLAALLTGLGPGWGMIRWYHRRSVSRPGCCVRCGYDLRATPLEGEELLEVCPECGEHRAMPSS